MFALIALSVGYAAFSKVLTINASATVTPNEEDFKVVTYGFKYEESMGLYDGSKEFEEDYLSNSVGVGTHYANNQSTGTNATIINSKNSTTISDINVTFNHGKSVFQYIFVVKNEGKYDAYINLKEFEYYEPILWNTGNCIAIEENANQEAINEACNNNEIYVGVYTSDFVNPLKGTEEEPYYKLNVGDYIYIEIFISSYENATILDPYSIEFDDIKFNFSTSP